MLLGHKQLSEVKAVFVVVAMVAAAQVELDGELVFARAPRLAMHDHLATDEEYLALDSVYAWTFVKKEGSNDYSEMIYPELYLINHIQLIIFYKRWLHI